MSRDVAGAQFTRPSLEAAPSGDGRFVAFSTGSPAADVFGRDRGVSPGVTKLLSAPADGPALGPAVTEFPVLSGDGQTVAFISAAADLVTDDQNALPDVFVHDRARNQTSRVSLGVGGTQPNGPSGTDSPPAPVGRRPDRRVLLRGFQPGDRRQQQRRRRLRLRPGRKETTRVSVGPGGVEATGGESYSPALSADGRYVAFASDATNLVGADDTNSATDVFVYDRQAKTTTRVSLGPGGAQGDGISYNPKMSADGALVAFTSAATNLVAGATGDGENVYLRDVKAGTTTRVSPGSGSGSGGSASPPSLSADGRFVAYASAAATLVPGDPNNAPDVFVFDRTAGTTERVSVGPGGTEGNRASDGPAISGDGRFVAFSSDATNLIPGDTNHGPTSSSATAGWARRPGSAWRSRSSSTRPWAGPARPHPCRATGPAPSRPSAATAASSPSSRRPRTWPRSPTPTPPRTSSSTTGHPAAATGWWRRDGGIFTYGGALLRLDRGRSSWPGPSWAWPRRRPGRATGWWRPTAASSPSATPGFFGSTGAIKLTQPIVGMAATPTGQGYWLVASDGGVFAFGDAGVLRLDGRRSRSTSRSSGWRPTPTGQGLLARRPRRRHLRLRRRRLRRLDRGHQARPARSSGWRPPRPAAATGSSRSDGGIFAFGDAAFFGSTGASKLNRPIVGMAATPSGRGYWLVASDGGIFAFGDAPFVGSAGATKLVQAGGRDGRTGLTTTGRGPVGLRSSGPSESLVRMVGFPPCYFRNGRRQADDPVRIVAADTTGGDQDRRRSGMTGTALDVALRCRRGRGSSGSRTSRAWGRPPLPGGAALTRIYDPSSATTTFTVDAGQAGHAALSFVTCPGAQVLDAGGPAATIVEALGGTTITFPSEEAGTYRVVLAGDTPGLGVGGEPSACGDPARCSSTRPWSSGPAPRSARPPGSRPCPDPGANP